MWDLAVEKDDQGEKEEKPVDVPPQLLFIHMVGIGDMMVMILVVVVLVGMIIVVDMMVLKIVINVVMRVMIIMVVTGGDDDSNDAINFGIDDNDDND